MSKAPEEAARGHFDLNARMSVSIHGGAFAVTGEPLDEPPRRLAAAVREAGLAPERFFVMRHGEPRLPAPVPQLKPRAL